MSIETPRDAMANLIRVSENPVGVAELEINTLTSSFSSSIMVSGREGRLMLILLSVHVSVLISPAYPVIVSVHSIAVIIKHNNNIFCRNDNCEKGTCNQSTESTDGGALGT